MNDYNVLGFDLTEKQYSKLLDIAERMGEKEYNSLCKEKRINLIRGVLK